MERRAFCVGAALNLAAAGSIWARQTAKRYRVGIIAPGGNPRSAPFFAAFEQRLRELGWVDGKNLSIDYEASDNPEQLAVIANGMIQHGTDIIVAVGPETTLKAASEATRTIPIVTIALNYDPVANGYVASLARPGRNITGVFFRNPEVGPKQLEFLLQAIPRAKSVGVLWTEFSADQIPPLDAAASRLGVQLEKAKLVPPYDVEGAFAALKAQRVDAVLAIGDPVNYRERARIAKVALEQRLAVVGGFPGAEAGYLIGFGPDLNAAMRNGAEYADKILRGARAADLPIEQPTQFLLTINLKTAKELEIAIPQSLLLRADEIVK